jgi:hypothetical protein
MCHRRDARTARRDTLHGASVRADENSFDDVLEFSHLLNGRTADNQVIDVDYNVASLVCIQTRSSGLEYLDRVELLFHVRVPAEWILPESEQFFFKFHDVGVGKSRSDTENTHKGQSQSNTED